MIPSLVRLPPTVLDATSIADLAACVRLVGAGCTVVVGAQRSDNDAVLDEFVVAAAVAAVTPGASIGVAARVGAGRAASIIAREATALDLLEGCDAVLLEGAARDCEDAATIITALFSPGAHTAVSGAEQIHDARNLPGPRTAGGPSVVWRRDGEVWTLDGGAPIQCGTASEVRAGERLAAPAHGSLVEIVHPIGGATALVTALTR